MAELVTIAEFDNVNRAYPLKARLEAEGITVYLQNETLSTVLAVSSTWAPVKVQVNLHDSFKAMDILYEGEEH